MSEVEVPVKIKKATPFLRWTGSKSWLIKSGVERYLPPHFNNYHEPFLGGGAMFFHLLPGSQTFLYDLNEELINTYIQIRDSVDEVIRCLKYYKNTKDSYYHVRGMKCRTEATRAARFIFLNRTSFNGIYRVNCNGDYNVPYGNRTKVDILTEANLRLVNKALQGVNLMHAEFDLALDHIQEEDLVYLDPPYTVAHENNGFIEYNSKLFAWEDQEKLAQMIQEIDQRGAFYILSNAEHLAIRNLYGSLGNIHSLSRYSKVGGRNKTRGMFNEVIITNVRR